MSSHASFLALAVAVSGVVGCKPSETCGNGVDDDEDGRVDCMDDECLDAPECLPPPPEDCFNGVDDDEDGLTDCGDPDCETSEPSCVAPDPDAGTPSDAGVPLDAAAPSGDPDPVGDLDPTNGDPALDLLSTEIFRTGEGNYWVRVTTAGPWPPPSTYFSWFSRVSVRDPAGPFAMAFVTQRHDGVDSTMAEGLPASDVAHALEADGFRVLFRRAFAASEYSVETGILRVEGGTFVQDFTAPALDATGAETAEFPAP